MPDQKTLQRFDDAIALMKTFCAGALPKDPFAGPAFLMGGAHSLILITLRNVYVKASTIKPADYEDFVLYALFWVAVTHHHHQVEEDWWFDALKGAVPKDDIVHEHDGFRQEIHDMEIYLVSCLPAGTKWGPYTDVVPAASSQTTFDAQRLEKVIEALVAAFVDHFCAEPGYLSGAKIRAKLTHEEMEALNDRLEKYIISQPPSFHVWSFVHRPSDDFPPMPWFLKRIVIPWIWWWGGSNLWRFAPTV